MLGLAKISLVCLWHIFPVFCFIFQFTSTWALKQLTLSPSNLLQQSQAQREPGKLKCPKSNAAILEGIAFLFCHKVFKIFFAILEILHFFCFLRL